jgi:hypothetical protein
MPETEGKQDPAGWAGIIQLLINALGGAAKYAVIVAGLLVALYFLSNNRIKLLPKAQKRARRLRSLMS